MASDIDRNPKQKLFIWSAMLLAIFVLLAILNASGSQAGSKNATVGKQSRRVTNHIPCIGNRQDTCIDAPSVDLYPAGSEGAVNTALRNYKSDTGKSVSGIVTAINRSTIEMRTTSSRTFSITFPVELASWWNDTIGPHYGNYQFGIDDTVTVHYLESVGQSVTTIEPDQISHSALIIDPGTAKSGSTKRYTSPQ